MTDREQRELAAEIKQAGYRVKYGRVNGRPCLHAAANRQSHTVFDKLDWLEYNVQAPRKRLPAPIDDLIITEVAT